MPDREIPARPSLEQYRKQAKDLARACSAGDHPGLTRVRQHHPRLKSASDAQIRSSLVLSDAQLVLAREHGFESWPQFSRHIRMLETIRSVEALGTSPADRVAAFLEVACVPRHGWHGSGDLEHAELILSRYPEVAGADVYTAAVLADEAAVRGFLARDPGAATAKGGVHGWDALTYLCFSRYLRLDPSRSDAFVKTARALLEAGASANTGWMETIDDPPRQVPETAIYGAAGIAHHAGLTRLLLEYGADPNDEETPYHVPETYDNEVMRIILESGKLNEKSRTWLALRKCDWHDLEGLQLALEYGADPNFLTHWKFTVLHQALRRDNRIEMIETLLRYGADPQIPNAQNGQIGFVMAARRGRGDVLALLERRGMRPEFQGVDALIAACACGDWAEAQAVAARHPELRDQVLAMGGTVLAEFAGNGNLEGVQCLLALGVPSDALHVEGDGYWDLARNSTALHVAAWRARHAVVRELIARGAPVDARDEKGRTALQLAVRACVDSYWKEQRGPDSVAALLEAGATAEGIRLPTGYGAIDELLAGNRLRVD